MRYTEYTVKDEHTEYKVKKGGESMLYEVLGVAASVAGAVVGVLVGAFVAGVEAGLDFSEEE